MSLAQEVAEAFLEPAAPAALAVVLFSTVCALCAAPKLRSGQSEVPIWEANVYCNANWQAVSESLKPKKWKSLDQSVRDAHYLKHCGRFASA